jgi:hypothetical protein
MEDVSRGTQEELILDSQVFQNQGSGNERLWQAVIDSAIAEWMRGPGLHKRKVEYFLFQDEDDFPFVCRSAGLNPEDVRETLWAIRAQDASGADVKVA